jgi:hypothetical protein
VRHVEAAVEVAQHAAGVGEHAREAHVHVRQADDLARGHHLGLAGEQARGAHAVAADVQQRPAVEMAVGAHVLLAGQREAEPRAHDAQVADGPVGDEGGGPLGLWVVAPHERLHEQAAGAVGGVERARHRVRPAVERLLAQHVLAGLERAHRPLDVQVVGQRDVDRLDPGVREQRFVGPVCARDAVRARIGVGRLLGAARDRQHLDLGQRLHLGQHAPVDVGRREDPPADGVHACPRTRPIPWRRASRSPGRRCGTSW